MSHLGIESEILRQPVQSETLQDVEPLALVLDFLERFPRLIHRSPRIIQSPSPVVSLLTNRSLTGSMLMSMTIGKREVGWVVRHRMALGGNPNTSIGYREIGLRNLGHSNILDRIALGLRAGSIKSILQLHIRIHRIILRRSFLLGDTII